MSDAPEGQREPRKMLTLAQVLEIVPFSRSTLFRMEREGTFPPSHLISPGRRIWFADDIAGWQDALPLTRVKRTA